MSKRSGLYLAEKIVIGLLVGWFCILWIIAVDFAQRDD